MKKQKQMTVREFFKFYPDDETCLSHIFECRYGDNYPCPKCESHTTWHRIKAARAYSCARCGNHLHPTVGTPFAKSRTSLQLWFYVIFLFTTTRHGVSAKEIQRQTGVTYKCAWRMGHEIRLHMGVVDGNEPLSGHIEIDETFLGGEVSGAGSGRRKGGKMIVLGMMARNGDVMTKVVDGVGTEMLEHVRANVEEGAVISTDGLAAYKRLPAMGYEHGVIRHSEHEHRKGKHSTAGIEGYWRILKASIASTHLHVSEKHLEKYLGEFEYRHNTRHDSASMFPRLVSVYPKQDS